MGFTRNAQLNYFFFVSAIRYRAAPGSRVILGLRVPGPTRAAPSPQAPSENWIRVIYSELIGTFPT